MSLPNGQIGRAYSATLVANGGTTPFSWSVADGALPAGLSVIASTGAITGTPTATANHASLTFQVRDSGDPVQTASVRLTMNVSPAKISVSISPQRAGLTLGQKMALMAATNDNAGVTWSIDPSGGSLDPKTSGDGEAVSLTAPATASVYTIAATSVTDATRNSSATIGVTNLAGVLTYHNDLARDGVNDQEYALTPANVSAASFGKLFACSVDGAIYTQPLWVANLTMKGAARNVVFVATQHDSVYAFDADASPCVQLWTANVIGASHGGTSGETTIPAGSSGFLVGSGDGDMMPEVGITGTPVIDAARGALYVVSKSVNPAGTVFYQRLHAIDLATGAEKPGSPVTIAATYPGVGDGGTSVAFNPRSENQRAGLALLNNGTVYVAWGSHEDAPPFYGWIIGYTYTGSSFTRSFVFNVAPNRRSGGIWMGGAAPAADSSNNLYAITSNGVFDAASATAPNNDYGDSFLKLSSSLGVLQYFTPSNEQTLSINNDDFGAGGAAVLGNLPSGSPITHLAIGGGKDGNLYVLNRDSLGGFGDSKAWQIIPIRAAGGSNAAGILCVGALWNDTLYLAGAGGALTAYQLNKSTALFSLSGSATQPSGGFGFPGTTPSVSALGNTNGIVWALDNSGYCTRDSPRCGPAVLHAYDATNVTHELWNSSMQSADAAGYAVKFVVPTVANGKVYVATRGNNTGGPDASTSVAGELDVYGSK